MSKNNMKLIMEGWRHSLKEMNAVQTGGVQTGAVTKKEEINEEELDEGMKEIALSAILGLAGLAIPSSADAGTMSTYNQTFSHDTVQKAATAATNAAAKNPAYNDLADVLNTAAAKDPTKDTYLDKAASDTNFANAGEIADQALYLLKRVEDGPKASSSAPSPTPDVPGAASSGRSTNAEVVLQMLQIQKQDDPQAAAEKAQSILDRAAQDGGGGVANMTPDVEKGLKKIAGVNETSLRESSI